MLIWRLSGTACLLWSSITILLWGLYSSNRQEGNFLARKLDRVLINPRWFEDFPSSFVEFKAQGVSDHCPALISFFKENHVDRPKPFKFFNCWARHVEFMNVVKESCCHFDDISKRVKDKRDQLEQVQLANISHDGCYIDDKKTLQNELHELEVAEASFYKQKAKIHWLKEGDRNTKFFHSAVMRKRQKNTIRLLYAEDGSRLDTFEAMSAEMVRFYTELLGIEDSGVKSCDVDVLKGLLVKEVSNEEIKASCSNKGMKRAQGLMDILLISSRWPEILSKWIFWLPSKNFFQTGTLLPAFNATTIVLMPKTPNAVLAALGLLDVFRAWIRACITGARFSVAFNGSLVGFLRNEGNQAGFADDLLIFCHGDESSVLGVVGVLGVFYELHGLQLNAGKSELFACGVHNDILSRVQAITGFKLGRFPIRNILANAGSLWVAWIKEYALKGSAFWEASPKPQLSWILRKLFKLKNEAVDLFGSVVDWNIVKSKWVWEKLRDKREKSHQYGNGLCDLCNTELEDKDHLFNDCAFVSGIWRKILQTCRIPYRNLCWSDFLDWATVNFRGKSLLVSILKLAWISLVYFVWEERNFRRFRGYSRSVDNIFDSIRRSVGDRINGCNINKADNVNLQFCLEWNIG
ncbi:uncharacterized protein LOC120214250 [Hibiscus syriacus]|uniref:uncharacterized protein LOC120214250 n=1 Tax=Hibiscus syriacus TaxID=106335 RepID=UPI0019212FD3|nr:uncharacterized protein LOC120214250 [Hibiscus syriacus]